MIEQYTQISTIAKNIDMPVKIFTLIETAQTSFAQNKQFLSNQIKFKIVALLEGKASLLFISKLFNRSITTGSYIFYGIKLFENKNIRIFPSNDLIDMNEQKKSE